MKPIKEIIFLVEEAIEGGYTAQALGESIFTEAETLEQLKIEIKDAVNCHFIDEEMRPQIIRYKSTKQLSELGKKLRTIRAEIIAQGKPLLTAEEVEIEKRIRQGEYQIN